MKKTCLAIAILGLFAGSASAAPIGPNFNLDGGDFSGVGGTGTGAGRTFTYTGLADDYGSFADVWFGVYNISGPLASTGAGGTSQSFGVSPAIVGNTATWTAANPWTINTTTGVLSYAVRYTFTATDLSNNPIALIDATTIAGLSGSGGAVFDVDPFMGSGFKTTQLFSAFNGTSWVAVDDLFNSIGAQLCINNCVIKSTSGGFWYDSAPAAVPEPTSLALLGTGLAFGARRLRKRARKQA